MTVGGRLRFCRLHVDPIRGRESRETARRGLIFSASGAKALVSMRIRSFFIDGLTMTRDLTRSFGLPSEHWVHLRTANPIGSTFATARHRPPAFRAALPSAWCLLAEEAAKRGRRIRAPEKVALALTRRRHKDGAPVPGDPPEEQRTPPKPNSILPHIPIFPARISEAPMLSARPPVLRGEMQLPRGKLWCRFQRPGCRETSPT